LTRKTILTVEDEFLVSAYLDEVLADAGYEVISARDADEAIRVLEQRDDIALIITDIDMPGSMDGLKLAAAVRDRWHPVEIVITTGKQRPTQDQMPATAAFIRKPYTSNDILGAIGRSCM
jgi:CheY-like chemotaxis protein